MHFPKKEGRGWRSGAAGSSALKSLRTLHSWCVLGKDPCFHQYSAFRIISTQNVQGPVEGTVGKVCPCPWKHVRLVNATEECQARDKTESCCSGSGDEEASLETAPPPLGLTKSQGPLKGGRQERTDRSLLAFFMKGGGGVEAKARTRENTLWTGRTSIPHICPDPPSGLPMVSDGGRCRARLGSRLLSALTWLWLLGLADWVSCLPPRHSFTLSLLLPFGVGQPTISTAFQNLSLSSDPPCSARTRGKFGQSRIMERKDPALSLRACPVHHDRPLLL